MSKNIKTFEEYHMNEFFFHKKQKDVVSIKKEELESILNELSIDFDPVYFDTMKKADSAQSISDLINCVDHAISMLPNGDGYINQDTQNTINKLNDLKSDLETIS